MTDTTYAIIGGGIVGLATAYRLTRQYPTKRVLILEKENELARHQTGHNSGVLHSGIYYRPGSLKARNCREGKLAMQEFCEAEGVPAVDHLDTRDLVTAIREEGAMKCGIAVGPDATPEDAKAELDACKGMSEHTDIGAQVSVDEPTVYEGGSAATVALIDCGAKGSIVKSLLERDATVHVLPYDATRADVEAVDPDVLFISNGPGDPENFEAAEALVESFVGDLPVAGICLGQQVVANALGGSTEKMAFGHRGVNQPVRDLESGRVVMTTQNHGYTVGEPGDRLNVTQVNVNDGTAEGLENEALGVITRQYHPEANPGPHDSLDFFDDVLDLVSTDTAVATSD
jgi:carbamoyl-phosphate synthase small subunit